MALGAFLSCPLMRLAVLVLGVVACLMSYLSYLCVVFEFILVKSLLTLQDACHHCHSLQMTEGAT